MFTRHVFPVEIVNETEEKPKRKFGDEKKWSLESFYCKKIRILKMMFVREIKKESLLRSCESVAS